MQQTLCLAKLQKASAKARRTKNQTKPALLPTPIAYKNHMSPNTLPRNTNYQKPQTTNTNRKTLTSAEFYEKRAKGICFWCDEKYEAGHKCRGKKPQLYHIEIEEIDDMEETEMVVEEKGEDKEDLQCAQISVQALEGMNAFLTM